MQIESFQLQVVQKYYKSFGIDTKGLLKEFDSTELQIIKKIRKLNKCLDESNSLKELDCYELFKIKRIQQQILYEQWNYFEELKHRRMCFYTNSYSSEYVESFELDFFIEEIKRHLYNIQSELSDLSFEIYNFEILSDVQVVTADVSYYLPKQQEDQVSICDTDSLATTLLDCATSIASTFIVENYI